MNIDVAKRIVFKNLGIPNTFFYRGPRNQNETFSGYINKAYPAIFTIITDSGKTMSFTYSDLIIDNLKIL